MTKSKRVPKLRRLLKLMQACPSGRRATRDLTLSQAWSMEHPSIAIWRGWICDHLGVIMPCDCEPCAWRKEYSAKHRAEIGWDAKPRDTSYATTPAKLPASLLKLWDGYEAADKRTAA